MDVVLKREDEQPKEKGVQDTDREVKMPHFLEDYTPAWQPEDAAVPEETPAADEAPDFWYPYWLCGRAFPFSAIPWNLWWEKR